MFSFTRYSSLFHGQSSRNSDWGGTDAKSLEKGITHIFSDAGSITLDVEDLKMKLVCCMSDGASVNFGEKTGLMTRLSVQRPGMIKIHCVNHRVELAVKETVAEREFSKVDDFYYSTTFLLKNSGKIKSEIKSAAHALNIQHYQLPKLTGTRFVGHRRAAFKCLLDTWPAMKLAFENIIADPKTRQETKAKVKGLLKKLNLYRFMSLVTCYLDILEIVTPISKLFEAERLLPFEVQPLVSETIANIDNCINASIDDDLLVSYLASFRLMDGELNSSFLKADDRTRSNSDRDRVSIAF